MEHDHEFDLPGDIKWVVRAYEFPNAEAAKERWEAIQGAWRGKQGNFSVWRTADPEQTTHLVVLCGQPERLPEVEGGIPFEMDYRNAHAFALRRARAGMDADEQFPGEHVEQEFRYGTGNPQIIDPSTGRVLPYKRGGGGR